jgi:hypothetical protein
MFVLDCLFPAESRQRMHRSSESQAEEGRELVAWWDTSYQYPEHEMFVLDCLVTAESRQSLHRSSGSQAKEGRELGA